MRFSIVVTTAESRFSAVAFRGDLAENLARVKRLGYQGVELSFRDPKTVDVAGLKVLLEKHDLPVVALATGRAWLVLYLVSDASRYCTGQIWRANGGQTIPR